MAEQKEDPLAALIDKHGKDAKTLENLSQAAESAERYDDMVAIMRKLVGSKIADKTAMTADERNLLSVAYKNVVGSKRQSWRVLDEEESKKDANVALASKYKKTVETELKDVCFQVLKLLNSLADQNEARRKEEVDDGKKEADECQVFYKKMIGDYYRYLTECFSSNEEYKKQCQENYQAAMDLAESTLQATHPTRLGLALNYSVCYYEILNEKKKACTLAKNAFDAAIEKLDSLNDISYKDSTLIMQLLRDNLTIWNSANEEEAEQAPDAQA